MAMFLNFDESLFRLINGLSGRVAIFDWLAIFLADYLGYFLILGATILFFQEKKWRERFYFFSLAALSIILSRGILTEAIRFFYYRPRPFITLGIHPLINPDMTGSFPSGHATAYFALATVVYYFCEKNKEGISRRWQLWFIGLTVGMGIARIFIGAHWPSDILVGAIIGIGSAYLVKQLLPAPTGGKIELRDDSRNKFDKDSRNAVNN